MNDVAFSNSWAGLPFWWLAAAIAGYVLLLAAGPARGSFADGARALRRYPELWAILGMLALGYALWQLGVVVFYHFALPEGEKPVFQLSRAFFLPGSARIAIMRQSVLPSLEGVAGIFNNVVTTFPVSVIAGVLLLVNWQGHHGVLNRALRRRFGGKGWAIHLFVTVCAVAAVSKPLIYLALPVVEPGWALSFLRVALCIDTLSFLFEYLFGVCIQIYVILLAFVWVRGLTFTHHHLLDFAIRRFSVVMRWSVIVMALSTLLIHVPQVLSAFEGPAIWMNENLPETWRDDFVRPCLVVFLLAFLSMQITLTFHSESLGEAVRDHFRFLLKNWWPVGWFLAVAFATLYGLTVANRFVIEGAGEGTALGIAWSFVHSLLQAVALAWLLAAWVSLFKTHETSHSHFETAMGRPRQGTA